MRDSLWFIPTLAVLAAAALAVVAVAIPTPHANSRLAWVWLFGGGAEGARGVLSVIAGSLITVTGVVFSVTIVALQLASSQFTPRVLRSFVADRTNQVVLGIFIGTFTYTLLVLRTIHSRGGGSELFVPQIGVAVALALLLVSIGALIVFINHAARSIQASVILHRETQETLAQVAELFPQELAEPDWRPAPPPPCPAEPPASVAALVGGYVQAVQEDALVDLAEGRRLTIRMEVRTGTFVVPGKVLASVWPAMAVDDAVRGAIGDAFVLGSERTPEQDVEFRIIEIADMAVKALSPGINDPTTAMLCIDRLTEILAALARRRPPAATRVSADGSLRFVALYTTFERAAGLAFDPIRHYGAANPSIAKKLLNALIDLVPLVPTAECRTLAGHVEAIVHSARKAIDYPSDLEAVERLGEAALRLAAAQCDSAGSRRSNG